MPRGKDISIVLRKANVTAHPSENVYKIFKVRERHREVETFPTQAHHN